MKIVFTKGAAGLKLAYPTGKPVEVKDADAKKYIEEGYAVPFKEETADSKANAKKETAAKKTKK